MDRRKSTRGKTAAELGDDMTLMHEIYEARRKESLSFADLEIKFGLRRSNGATAYRMIRRYEALAQGDE